VDLVDSRESRVAKKRDFSGVVVWLEPEPASPIPQPAKAARMIQRDKTFIPHVLAVTTGATVEFPNYDPIFHNAFSNYEGQVFDLGLYPPGTTRSVRFARPGVVRIFCNIHEQMSAVIVVVDTPWYATTAQDGSFSIHGVPAGEYQLRVFHERAAAAVLQRLSRSIEVTNQPLGLPIITISESGYLAIPHKNKYGKDYVPAPQDGVLYPAVRK
jgi:plastocyanin